MEVIKAKRSDQVIEYIKDRHQIIQLYIQHYLSIVRQKNFDHNLFQFFGDMDFLHFINTMFDFIRTLLPVLDTFPSERTDIFTIISEIDLGLIDVIFSNYDAEIILFLYDFLRLEFFNFIHTFTEL